MNSGFLSEMNQRELSAYEPEVVILPIGSTEVHAWHLPYGTDSITGETLGRRIMKLTAARGCRALFMPTIHYSVVTNITAFPFSVGVTPTTLIRVCMEILGNLAEQGVRKVVILNNHGGNIGTMDALMRTVHAELPLFVTIINPWGPAEDVIEEIKETDDIGHACEIETSICLDLFGDLVDMDEAVPTHSSPHKLPTADKIHAAFVKPWHIFTTTGGMGDPTKATKEKGAKLNAVYAERIADLVCQLAETELTDNTPYYKPE
ncbi:creatininase family protein [candidate division KSB1 bacterium]